MSETTTTKETSAMNVQTHTGTVHNARTSIDGRLAPACRKAEDLHYATPTTAPVTCGYCTKANAPAVRKDADPAERAAARAAKRAADKAAAAAYEVAKTARRQAVLAERIEWYVAREAEMVATNDDRLETLRAELAAARTELAG